MFWKECFEPLNNILDKGYYGDNLQASLIGNLLPNVKLKSNTNLKWQYQTFPPPRDIDFRLSGRVQTIGKLMFAKHLSNTLISVYWKYPLNYFKGSWDMRGDINNAILRKAFDSIFIQFYMKKHNQISVSGSILICKHWKRELKHKLVFGVQSIVNTFPVNEVKLSALSLYQYGNFRIVSKGTLVDENRLPQFNNKTGLYYGITENLQIAAICKYSYDPSQLTKTIFSEVGFAYGQEKKHLVKAKCSSKGIISGSYRFKLGERSFGTFSVEIDLANQLPAKHGFCFEFYPND